MPYYMPYSHIYEYYIHCRVFKYFEHKTDINILSKTTKLFWTINLN